MDRILAACLVTAVLGLAALGFLAYAVAPAASPIGSLERREGQRVCVEGVLAHYRATTHGTVHFAVEDGADSVHGVTSLPWTAVPGDRVRACGGLARDGAEVFLRPERPGDLEVVEPWDERVVHLSNLAARPWEFLGQHVTTVGVLAEEGRRHYLVDDATSSRLRVVGADGRPHGVELRVGGIVEYDADESAFRLRIVATAEPGRAAA